MRQHEINRRGRLCVTSSLFVLFFCVALSANAAEAGGNSATENANEIFKWINFAIVAAVLIWLFAKKLPPWFRGNADRISSAITKATAAREHAERQVREAETRLAQLQQEIATLQARCTKRNGRRRRAHPRPRAKRRQKGRHRGPSGNRSCGARRAPGTESPGGIARR